jgi:O-antigen/teichoic acid export membrane protein
MLRKILFTFSSRFFVTAVNFLVILITARYLGAEGRGIISLLVLGITINLLVSNVFGGAAIAYLAPRLEIFRLVAPAYTWAVISSAIVTAVLMTISLLPGEYAIHLLLLSLLQSFYNIHLNLLIGKSRIREHNIINALQVAVLIIALCMLIFFFQIVNAHAYIMALYASLVFSFLLSLFMLKEEVRFFPPGEWFGIWKTIFRNGFIIQIAALAQLMNYRLSYYILSHYTAAGTAEGTRMVGIYATAVNIAEAVWLVGRSMGLIQYARIVNENDDAGAGKLTIRFAKISLTITAVVLIPLLLAPAGFYSFVFGNEFKEIPFILLYLMPGILSFGLALMFSNYFAGKGLNSINLYGSLAGLAVTICMGILVVPLYGMKGAAITASLSYVATSAYLWYAFRKKAGYGRLDFIPDKSDWEMLGKETKKFLESIRK